MAEDGDENGGHPYGQHESEENAPDQAHWEKS
jgi:hypothetical protein